MTAKISKPSHLRCTDACRLPEPVRASNAVARAPHAIGMSKYAAMPGRTPSVTSPFDVRAATTAASTDAPLGAARAAAPRKHATSTNPSSLFAAVPAPTATRTEHVASRKRPDVSRDVTGQLRVEHRIGQGDRTRSRVD